MKLIVINGSPRGKNANSNVIANWILSGMDDKVQAQIFYNVQRHTHKETILAIEDNTTVLLIFPLYVDAMPGIVKLFIEELDSIAKKRNNVNMYYVVQSGFGGAAHSRVVEQYLIYLTDYLGFNYKGTAIKPEAEGLRLMPENYTKHIKNDFMELSKDIQQGLAFNQEVLTRLAGFEVPTEEYKEQVKKSNGESGYFTYLLKQNNAIERSFDTPYKRKK